MVRQEYISFIEAFERLSPYDLDHFCKSFHKHYESTVKKREQEINAGIDLRDVREILLEVMKTVQLELAERKVEAAQANLAAIKAKLFNKWRLNL